VLPSTQGRPLSALMLASETRRPAARHRERGGAIAGRAKAEERAGLEPTLPPQPSARALPWEAVLIAPRLPSRQFFQHQERSTVQACIWRAKTQNPAGQSGRRTPNFAFRITSTACLAAYSAD
jgi:hypothetical protein